MSLAPRPSILAITDRVGGDLANGSQVFSDALLKRLAQWYDLSVIVADKPSGRTRVGRVLAIGDVAEEPLEGWLARNIDFSRMPLVYNIGATLFSCQLTDLVMRVGPRLSLINHFQVLLGEYARHEGIQGRELQWLRLAQESVAHQARCNLFPSFSELFLAESAWGMDGPAGFVVPNAFVDARVPVQSARAENFTFLAAGRFSDYAKGADLLYRAFAKVSGRYPAARLVIAADDRRFLEILQTAPQGSWTYRGWLNRRDLLAAMGSADVVVVPSRYEPFGLVAVEAMAMGTPVIAMAVGGLAETVHHGRSGWLTRPSDGSQGLREAMEVALDAGSEIDGMGESARRYARREFSLSRIADLVRRHIDAVLADGVYRSP